jgi:hypothetical protein
MATRPQWSAGDIATSQSTLQVGDAEHRAWDSLLAHPPSRARGQRAARRLGALRLPLAQGPSGVDALGGTEVTERPVHGRRLETARAWPTYSIRGWHTGRGRKSSCMRRTRQTMIDESSCDPTRVSPQWDACSLCPLSLHPLVLHHSFPSNIQLLRQHLVNAPRNARVARYCDPHAYDAV